MTDPINKTNKIKNVDVAIIGAGPAGLSAAIELHNAGIQNIIVLEREPEAGGIPRHCGHPPFGLREFKRIMTGPAYAKKLVETALNANINIQLKTTVIKMEEKGILSIASNSGLSQIIAKRVLLATGIRETPRSARFVSGDRALGIFNTGALQSMVYLKEQIPFKNPIIIGTELVSFSALSTCKHAGIKPVAMLEEKPQAHLRWPSPLIARYFGVPLFVNTRVSKIIGKERITAIEVINKQEERREIQCDGILFTGEFTPESTLARMSHLALDYKTGSPKVDKYGRCSDKTYYVAGNVLQSSEASVPFYYRSTQLPPPVETAGKSWQEGKNTAKNIISDLAGKF